MHSNGHDVQHLSRADAWLAKANELFNSGEDFILLRRNKPALFWNGKEWTEQVVNPEDVEIVDEGC